MRHVTRNELLDYQTYDDRRDGIRREIMSVKKPRRVHLGDRLTFLFENTDTIRYQIQEMMRAERLVRESDIEHELETYNGLLGDTGELGCCLLIEIDDRAERARLLREWHALPEHLYLELSDGSRVRPLVDHAQQNDEKLSSVQYLKFPVGDGDPVAVGADLEGLTLARELTEEQRQALRADLAA